MTTFILIMLLINLALSLSLAVFAMNVCATVKLHKLYIDQQNKCLDSLLEINITNRGRI